jgi:hypothetical protein
MRNFSPIYKVNEMKLWFSFSSYKFQQNQRNGMLMVHNDDRADDDIYIERVMAKWNGNEWHFEWE